MITIVNLENTQNLKTCIQTHKAKFTYNFPTLDIIHLLLFLPYLPFMLLLVLENRIEIVSTADAPYGQGFAPDSQLVPETENSMKPVWNHRDAAAVDLKTKSTPKGTRG